MQCDNNVYFQYMLLYINTIRSDQIQLICSDYIAKISSIVVDSSNLTDNI